jgi:hypothetical protein
VPRRRQQSIVERAGFRAVIGGGTGVVGGGTGVVGGGTGAEKRRSVRGFARVVRTGQAGT